MKKILIASTLLALCAGVNAATQDDFQKAYDAAEAARMQAAAVEYEWNTIAPLMSKAKETADAGNFEEAIELANEAQKHGELAYKQSQIEAANWRNSVIK